MFNSYTGTSLAYDPARCINCKRCIQVCPHAVFAEGPCRVELKNPASCMECGACARNCPVQAISVQSGVGCAWAMIGAALRGKDMDTECSCGGEAGSCGGGRLVHQDQEVNPEPRLRGERRRIAGILRPNALRCSTAASRKSHRRNRAAAVTGSEDRIP